MLEKMDIFEVAKYVLTKAGKISYLNRPVNKLYPWKSKVKMEKYYASEKQGSEEASVSNVPNHEKERSRKAATRISERHSHLRHVAAETGILKRLLSEHV